MTLYSLFIGLYNTFEHVCRFLFMCAQIPIVQHKQIVTEIFGEQNFDVATIECSWEGCEGITAASLQTGSNGKETIFAIDPMEKWKDYPLSFFQNACLQTC